MKRLLVLLLIMSCGSAIAAAAGPSVGSHYVLNGEFLTLYSVRDIEKRPAHFDNNVLRIEGYVNSAESDVQRLYPSKLSFKRYRTDELIDIVADNHQVKSKIVAILRVSCVVLTGLFSAYTKNYFGYENAGSDFGRLYAMDVDDCGPAGTSAPEKTTAILASIAVADNGNYTQAYLSKDGRLVFATDGGCDPSGLCHVFIVRGAAIAVHIGRSAPPSCFEPKPEQNCANTLVDAMPGPGDGNLLRAYEQVLFVTRGGARFGIYGTADRPRLRYLGGGNTGFGAFVERIWEPNHQRGWYVARIRKFLSEE